MPAISATALALGLGVAGAGVASAAIGAHAAGKAADAQSQAALNAAQIEANQAQKALDFQKQVYNQNLQLAMPWLQAGEGGLANLAYLMGLIDPAQAAQAQAAAGAAGSAQPNNGLLFPIPAGTPSPGTLPSGPKAGPQIGPNGELPFSPQFRPFARANIQPIEDIGPRADGAVKQATSKTVAPGTGTFQLPSLNSLINPSLGGKGSLLAPFGEKFAAPTNVTEQNDPGYRFRLQQGMDALQNSAAAKGTLLQGGTLKDLSQFAQDYASNEYANVYDRAMREYLNRYNIYNQDQTNTFNRLAALAGLGQTSSGQLINSGNTSANNLSNILLSSGAYQGNQINNAAAARASGYVGAGNAYSGALSNLGNLGLLLPLLFGNKTASS
jgi:hypothetical protein